MSDEGKILYHDCANNHDLEVSLEWGYDSCPYVRIANDSGNGNETFEAGDVESLRQFRDAITEGIKHLEAKQ